ncbi:MAG: HAMP domain-containing histidine kinase, partial [Armatimonadetes bacterium]|nr:HAMP domain-containing histidine kinase [Anaerolineae bacterium]
LTHHLNIDHVISLGLDIVLRLSRAEAGMIALLDESGKLSVKQTLGYPATVSVTRLLYNGVIQRVQATQRPELIFDVYTDPDYHAVLATTQALITIPLISQDTVIGVVHLETPQAVIFTPEVFAFLQLITARIAAAAHNATLYETSRQQLEELQRLYAQVSTLEQMKTDMIRIAAHDLRNPLTSITLSVHVVRKLIMNHMTPMMREHLLDIDRALERMRKITSDILSLERINKAASGDFTELVDLRTLVQGVYEEHRTQARQKQQSYTLLLTPMLLMVRGDQFELHEAVANFITNALKYTPEGGVITVNLTHHAGQALLEVKDTGYGIPADQQARLFQPFYRARTEETEKIEGTGLGLHLVKNIIERHKGTIMFSSSAGKGSTFGFVLPISASVTSPAVSLPQVARSSRG